MQCLIVDDHPLTREGTSMALRAIDANAQVHEAESLEHARELLVRERSVDLILLDLDLRDVQGIATLQRLKEWIDAEEIDARIVVLSGHCEPGLVRAVINQYGTGFIQKATSRNIFLKAIELTLAGGVYIPEIVLSELSVPPVESSGADLANASIRLTPREAEVAAFLVRGFTYKRIARALEDRNGSAMSEHTVRVHVGNIAWKLGVTENAKAGVMAEIARRGLKFPCTGVGR